MKMMRSRRESLKNRFDLSHRKARCVEIRRVGIIWHDIFFQAVVVARPRHPLQALHGRRSRR